MCASTSKFELVEAEKAGLRFFVLILKPDLTIGYVIYHVPPTGRAEVIIGSGWSEEDLSKIKEIIKEKIGDVDIDIVHLGE